MEKKGVRKGAWTTEEDTLLRKCIEKYGEGKWHQVPFRAGLNRCRKSCRLRWLNYLRPDIKRGYFSRDEVDLILRLHKLLGNRWSLIAGRLPGRTANDVKNFWNTHVDKKLAAASTVSRERNNYCQSKPIAVDTSNIIRPRPRNFRPQAPNQSPDQHMSRVNKRQNDDQSVKNIQPSPTPEAKPRTTGCDTENPKNNLQPYSSSTPEKADERIRWWKDLLETTEGGGLSENPFPIPDKEDDLGIEVPVLLPGLDEENSFWNPGGFGSLCQEVEHDVDVDHVWELL